MTDEVQATDTAERPAVLAPPAQPPSQPPARPQAQPPVRPLARDRRPPAPPWIAWLVVGVTLVSVAVLGGWLVVRNPGADTTAGDPAATQSQDPTDDEQPAPEPSGEPSASAEAEQPQEPVGETVDLTASATAQVPRSAPSNNDVTGELVTFEAPNMLDGDPATCWRMAGDGTGALLTFTFASPVTVSRVGLVNGYAKTSVDDSGQAFDWYHGNRRLLRAEWVVGDQTFPQDLGDSTALQVLDIAPTQTTTIGLRLVEVSPPGSGSTGRDYTALSDVSFTGTTS